MTVDSDCSLDIKRHLLPRRKAMRNLDSVLKSRDITLPTKVHIVKAMVFSAVMYRCERVSTKKLMLSSWCRRRLLRVPWTARRSNQSILKEINPEYSLERLMLKTKLQYFGQLMWGALIGIDPEAGKSSVQEEKGVTEDEMIGWHHWLNGQEFGQTPGDSEGQRSLAWCNSWGHRELDMTVSK